MQAFTFHDKPIGYWFSEHFDRTVACPCCGKPGVALRYPRERERRLWAHAMDAEGWLSVCEKRKRYDAPARLQARKWLAERWDVPGPAATARELGINVQLAAAIHGGRMPLPRSLPAVIAAFAKAGIAAEAWAAPPVKYVRVAFLQVFPRVPPRRGLDAAAGGC